MLDHQLRVNSGIRVESVQQSKVKSFSGGLYTQCGYKLRFLLSGKAQFPGTARQGRCVTVGII